MVSVKDKAKQFIAKIGIDFEGLKPEAHVDVGDPIPASVSAEEIDELIAIGAIEEKK